MSSLTGLPKIWLNLRNNNCVYLTNKVFSVLISFSLAVMTLSFKPTLTEYSEKYPEHENVASYSFMYWLLFIYYGFAGLDELIELYAVYFQREKGALGLLFEMNYFLGFGTACYIVWFMQQAMSAISDPLYVGLYDFIKMQVNLLYAGLAVSILMIGWFYYLNTFATRAEAASKEAYIKAQNEETHSD